MDNIVKVFISGPALSLLLYENLRCPFNQEGFLLGKKYPRMVSKITDHEEAFEITEWEIHVNSLLACPKLASFYNASGMIMQESLQAILSDLYEDVVGWYTFKKDPDVKLRLREKIVHKRLSAVFSTDAMEHFVWCSNNSLNTQEKHTSKQTFIRYLDGVSSPGRVISGFQELPLHIINLSDTKNTYKSAGIPSVSLNSLIPSLKASAASSSNDNLITRIEDTLQKKIGEAVKDIAASEAELFELEQEISELMHCPDAAQTQSDYLMEECSVIEDGEETTPAKSKRLTRQQQLVAEESSTPVNGNVSFGKGDRGDSCASPATPTAVNVSTPSPRSYSQATKLKQ